MLLLFSVYNIQEHYYFEVSNGLDPDLNQGSVGPDLGPNCLQMLSEDYKSHRKERFNSN